MGDRRYDVAYHALAEAPDRMAVLRGMTDEAVVHALAAASRKMDSYLANVLAVELLKRRRRQRAVAYGLIAGLGTAVVVRSVYFLLADGARQVALPSLLLLLSAFPFGLGVGWWVYRRP